MIFGGDNDGTADDSNVSEELLLKVSDVDFLLLTSIVLGMLLKDGSGQAEGVLDFDRG